jgi:hypothetical protein
MHLYVLYERAASMREKRNAYRVLVRKPELTRFLGRTQYALCSSGPEEGSVMDFCEYGNETSGFVNFREFSD